MKLLIALLVAGFAWLVLASLNPLYERMTDYELYGHGGYEITYKTPNY